MSIDHLKDKLKNKFFSSTDLTAVPIITAAHSATSTTALTPAVTKVTKTRSRIITDPDLPPHPNTDPRPAGADPSTGPRRLGIGSRPA